MILHKSIIILSTILLSLLFIVPATLANAAESVNAIKPGHPIIYVDGHKLQLRVEPIIIN
jgi:hypothetical protein